MKYNSIKARVEETLAKYPITRDDDRYLWAQVVADYYTLPERLPETWYEVAGIMQNTPSMNYIAKCRRDIIVKNNFRKYLPTTASIASFRGIDTVLWDNYAKLNPGEVEIDPPASNYPSHISPEEIARLGI